MTRVAITGLGMISPVGIGREDSWASLTAGRSGIAPVSLFDASTFPVRIAGEVKGFDSVSVVERFPEAAATRDRKVLLALAAADEAIADAVLPADVLQKALLSIGVGLEVISLEDLVPHAPYAERGHPFAAGLSGPFNGQWHQTPLDHTARLLGRRCGFLAGRYTNCSACAAGTQAVGEAWLLLREREAVIALAGATDSMLNPLGLGGFSLLRVLSDENDRPERACRPFDATRQGTVLGEGAAFLVLETLDHARARGAKVYAEILGYGSSLDAFGVSDPEPCGRGAIDSMRRALRSAGLSADQIDCVNAHGTGTPKNDAIETAAIKTVLGRRAHEIPVHSIKSMTGHMIAASGALEAAVAALTIARNTVPPTINLEQPDPLCDLDYVAGHSRLFAGNYILSNSFGFGGQNATLIFGRCT